MDNSNEEFDINVARAQAILRNNNFLESIGISTKPQDKQKRRKLGINSEFICVHGCDWKPDNFNGKKISKQFHGHQSQCSYFKQNMNITSCAGRTRQSSNKVDTRNDADINENNNDYNDVNSNNEFNNDFNNDIEIDNGSDYEIDYEYNSSDSDESEQLQTPVIDLSLPSMFILNYQRMLESTLSKVNLVDIRCRKIKENVKHIKSDDYIRLASIGSIVGISESNGDKILKIIQEIVHNNGSNIELPLTWRSVNNALSKNAKKESTVTPILIPLNPEIWGEFNLSSTTVGTDTKLKIPFAWKYDFREVIGEKFLNSDPDGVLFMPDYDNLKEYKEDENGNIVKDDLGNPVLHIRTYNSFFQSNMCKLIYEGIIRMHGKTSQSPYGPEFPPVENLPIYTVISEDEAGVNSNKSKSIEPLVVDFINFHSTEKDVGTNINKGIFLLGMAPINPLMMSDDAAHVHLKNRNFNIKKHRDLIIMLEKRRIHFKYLGEVLKDLDSIKPHGAYVQIGSTNTDNLEINISTGEYKTPKIICGFCVILQLTGDNKALNILNSCHSTANGRRCRICDAIKMNCFSDTDLASQNYRDHNMMKSKSEQYEKSLNSYFLANRGDRVRATIATDEFKTIEKECKDYNIIAGSNPIHLLGDYLNQVTGLTYGTSIMMFPDELHTLLKGPVEMIIVIIMNIAYLLKDINPDKYGSIIGIIDERMKSFPRKQAVTPFIVLNMPNGLSCYISNNRVNTKAAVVKLVGALSASRLPGILWMLIHVIGNSGEVFPTQIILKHRNNNKYKEDDLKLKEVVKDKNVQTMILNAAKSCINLVSASRREDNITDDYVNLLKKLTSVMRLHLTVLLNVRNILKHVKAFKFDIVPVISKSIKPHYLCHVPESIPFLGPKSIIDTQRTEHEHLGFKGNVFIYFRHCLLNYAYIIWFIFCL